MQKRSQERDHARDAAAKASQLLKSFVQLEDAGKTLQSLKEQEEAITKQQELAVRVEDAWELQAVYQRFLDCKKMLEKLRSDLQEQTEQLPNLMEDTKLCIQNTKNAKHQQEEEVAAFTKVEEKVKKAMEVFTKMEAAGQDVIQKEKAVQNAEEKERALKAKKSNLKNSRKRGGNAHSSLHSRRKILLYGRQNRKISAYWKRNFPEQNKRRKNTKHKSRRQKKDVLPIGRPAWNLKKKMPFMSRNERSF